MTFNHVIGETVRLRSLETPVFIDALLLDSSGEQYRVVYWCNGERKSTWVYEWELTK